MFLRFGFHQVFLGHSGGLDTDGNELPRLVYVSREKRPGFNHHKKAGAMNALVRVSAVLTNAPFFLNLDCDHYINNSKALREAMCFLMDPTVGKRVCYVQFPQRFDGIDRNDRYANHNTVFFDVSNRNIVREHFFCFWKGTQRDRLIPGFTYSFFHSFVMLIKTCDSGTADQLERSRWYSGPCVCGYWMRVQKTGPLRI